MYKDMDTYEQELGLRRIRNTYPELELSDDQAIRILEMEDEVRISGIDTGRKIESFSLLPGRTHRVPVSRMRSPRR